MSEGSGSHALERASAWMLREPGRWTGMSLMSFRLQNLRRWIVRQVSLNDLVPPSLMMYDTTTALSYIRHSTRDLSWGKNPATREHCLHLQHIDVLVCLLPGQCPLQLMGAQLGPHLWLEASVKRVISASKALSETPCSTAGEDHQAASWRMVRVTEILSDQDPVSWHHASDTHHWIGRGGRADLLALGWT